MKSLFKKNYKIVLFLIALVILGPIIINTLFEINSSKNFLKAEWDASAMLSYYGTIIASLIAIYGVSISIQYSQKGYKEDVRNRVLPFIAISVLKTSYYRKLSNLTSDLEDNEQKEGYREFKIEDYYCVLKDGEMIFRTGLTKAEQQLLNNGGLLRTSCEGGYAFRKANCINIPIEIENVGNGAAIKLRCGFNRQTTEVKKGFNPISLKQGRQIMLHIFSDDCSQNSKNLGKYELSFCYEDIYLNMYEQNFGIEIYYDEKMKRSRYKIDMSHNQTIIEKHDS